MEKLRLYPVLGDTNEDFKYTSEQLETLYTDIINVLYNIFFLL